MYTCTHIFVEIYRCTNVVSVPRMRISNALFMQAIKTSTLLKNEGTAMFTVTPEGLKRRAAAGTDHTHARARTVG